MKTTYSISILLLLSFTSVCFAQTHYENLKEADKQRALTNERNKESDRQNAHNNRAFETNTPNATNTDIPTSNSTWGMTSRYEREQKERAASEAKNKALLNTYEAKVAVIKNCFKTLGKTKDNYEKICNCALSNGVDYNTTYRVVGFSAEEFQMNIDRENDDKYSKNYSGNNNSSTDPNVNGNFSGYGTKKYQQGTYVGNIISGVMNGYGKLTYSAGDSYEGNFKDNVKIGKGLYKFTDGGVYNGDFVNDKRTGKGVLIWANGDKYEGDFFNDIRTGNGIYTWANGDKYDGGFLTNALNGKGKLIWINGNIYEGDFVNGIRNGKGIYTYSNGDTYQGVYLNGKRNENGKHTKKSGFYSVGVYKNGVVVEINYYSPSNKKISKSEYEKN